MQTEARLTRARARATATRKPSQAETSVAGLVPTFPSVSGLVSTFPPCRSSYRGVVHSLTAPLPYTTSKNRTSSSKQTDLPRAVLFEVTNKADSPSTTSSLVEPAPEDSSEPSTQKQLTEHSVEEEAPPDSHADEELSEPEGPVAEPENTCLSGCVASTPTRVEVPVLQPARTPYSLPKAFGSPAVFTGSPESSNIDNTLVTGTPRPILEQARSPNPLPKAFDSPAVFTGPPESSDIDFAVGSGTASAIADRFVAMEAMIESPTSVAVKESVMQPAPTTPVTAAGEEADVQPAATTPITITATEEHPAAPLPAALKAGQRDSAEAEDTVNLADFGESTRHGGAADSLSRTPKPELQPILAPPNASPNASAAKFIHGTLQPCVNSTDRSASPIIARHQPLTKIGVEFVMARTPRKNTALGTGPQLRGPLSVDRTGHHRWSASKQPGNFSASAGLLAHGPGAGMRRTSADHTFGAPRPASALQPYSRRFGLPPGGFTPTPEVKQAFVVDQHTDVKAAAATPSSAEKCSGPGPSSDGAKLQRQLFPLSNPVSEHSERAIDRPILSPRPCHEETPGLLAEAIERQPTPVASQHEPKEELLAQEEHVEPEAAEAEELFQEPEAAEAEELIQDSQPLLRSGAPPAAAGTDLPELLEPHAGNEAAEQPSQPQVSGSVLAKQGSAAHAARLEAIAQSWFPQPSPSALMPFATGPEMADGVNGQQDMDIGLPSAESGLLSKPLQSEMTQTPPQQPSQHPLQQPEGADKEEHSPNHAQTSAEPGAAAKQTGTSALRCLAAVNKRPVDKLTKLAEQRIRPRANIKKGGAAAANSEAFNNLDALPEEGCPPTVGLLGMPPIGPGAQNPPTQRNPDQGKSQPSVPQGPVSRRPGIPESGRPPKAAGKASTQGSVRPVVMGPSARKQAALAKLEAQHAPQPSRFLNQVPLEGPTIGQLVAMEEGSGLAAVQKGSSRASGVQPSEASTDIPRSLRQLKKEVKSKLAAKQLSKPAQSSTSSIYTDVHVPKKASEDDEAISSLTDAIGGLGIASGSPMPLRGVPVRQGHHLHFDDDGKPSAATPKVQLRGVPVAAGKHKRFDQ